LDEPTPGRSSSGADAAPEPEIEPAAPEPRAARARHVWRLIACGVIGFFGTHGVLLAFGVFGLPTLLLFIVLGVGAAAVDTRRSAFLAMWLGVALYFAIMTTLYLGTRPDADAQYDVLAPAVVVGGSALAGLFTGSGYLLHRLLRDHTPDTTIDG